MKKLDIEQFKYALKNRKPPKKSLKTITVRGVTINNVPVIEHEEGSLEFTLDFNTSLKIYDLLLENRDKKEVDFESPKMKRVKQW